MVAGLGRSVPRGADKETRSAMPPKMPPRPVPPEPGEIPYESGNDDAGKRLSISLGKQRGFLSRLLGRKKKALPPPLRPKMPKSEITLDVRPHSQTSRDQVSSMASEESERAEAIPKAAYSTQYFPKRPPHAENDTIATTQTVIASQFGDNNESRQPEPLTNISTRDVRDQDAMRESRIDSRMFSSVSHEEAVSSPTSVEAKQHVSEVLQTLSKVRKSLQSTTPVQCTVRDPTPKKESIVLGCEVYSAESSPPVDRSHREEDKPAQATTTENNQRETKSSVSSRQREEMARNSPSSGAFVSEDDHKEQTVRESPVLSEASTSFKGECRTEEQARNSPNSGVIMSENSIPQRKSFSDDATPCVENRTAKSSTGTEVEELQLRTADASDKVAFERMTRSRSIMVRSKRRSKSCDVRGGNHKGSLGVGSRDKRREEHVPVDTSKVHDGGKLTSRTLPPLVPKVKSSTKEIPKKNLSHAPGHPLRVVDTSQVFRKPQKDRLQESRDSGLEIRSQSFDIRGLRHNIIRISGEVDGEAIADTQEGLQSGICMPKGDGLGKKSDDHVAGHDVKSPDRRQGIAQNKPSVVDANGSVSTHGDNKEPSYGQGLTVGSSDSCAKVISSLLHDQVRPAHTPNAAGKTLQTSEAMNRVRVPKQCITSIERAKSFETTLTKDGTKMNAGTKSESTGPFGKSEKTVYYRELMCKSIDCADLNNQRMDHKQLTCTPKANPPVQLKSESRVRTDRNATSVAEKSEQSMKGAELTSTSGDNLLCQKLSALPLEEHSANAREEEKKNEKVRTVIIPGDSEDGQEVALDDRMGTWDIQIVRALRTDSETKKQREKLSGTSRYQVPKTNSILEDRNDVGAPMLQDRGDADDVANKLNHHGYAQEKKEEIADYEEYNEAEENGANEGYDETKENITDENQDDNDDNDEWEHNDDGDDENTDAEDNDANEGYDETKENINDENQDDNDDDGEWEYNDNGDDENTDAEDNDVNEGYDETMENINDENQDDNDENGEWEHDDDGDDENTDGDKTEGKGKGNHGSSPPNVQIELLGINTNAAAHATQGFEVYIAPQL